MLFFSLLDCNYLISSKLLPFYELLCSYMHKLDLVLCLFILMKLRYSMKTRKCASKGAHTLGKILSGLESKIFIFKSSFGFTSKTEKVVFSLWLKLFDNLLCKKSKIFSLLLLVDIYFIKPFWDKISETNSSPESFHDKTL